MAARFVTERDGHFAIDRSCFDPTTGRATTERMIIRDGPHPPLRVLHGHVRGRPAPGLAARRRIHQRQSRRPAYRREPPHDLHRVLVDATVQRSRYSSSSVPIMDPYPTARGP